MDQPWAVEWRTAGHQANAWTATHPSHGPSKQVEMVSFGVDPQWGGLLFSLCSRHEDAGAVLGAGGGILFPNILADPLATSSASPAADMVNVLGSGCLDLYSMSSVWAIIVETAKATGMVVLFGVGSMLFYRVYHSVWPRVRSRLHDLKGTARGGARGGTKGAARGGARGAARGGARAKVSPAASPQRSMSSGEESDGECSEDDDDLVKYSRAHGQHLLHDFETLAEDVEVTGLYFGPGAASSMEGSTTSLPLAGPVERNPSRAPASRAPSAPAAPTAPAVRRARRRSQQLGELNRRWDSSVSQDEEARDADVSEGSRSPRTPPGERVSGLWRGGRRDWRGLRGLQGLQGLRGPPRGYSANGTPSSSSSLSPEYPPYRHRLNNQESPTRRRSRRQRQDAVDGVLDDPLGLPRDDSTDSLARRFMARDESFESLFACQQAGAVAVGRRRSLSRHPSTDSLCYPRRLPRNESLDSLGFPRRSALTRGSSFDSTCSELSLDASLIADLEAKGEPDSTLACLEQLQREIDQLKSNCLSLDEEFETVRCNRNLPGMSSLLEVKGGDEAEEAVERARARACFAGLYSLTRITSSPSLDLDGSDWDGSATPPRGPATLHAGRVLPTTVNEEPPMSLEWDEEGLSSYLMDPLDPMDPLDRLESMDPTDSGVVNDLDLGACAANTSPPTKSEGFQRRQLSLETSCPSLRDSDSMLTSSLATFELDGDSEVGDAAAPLPELDQESAVPADRERLHLALSERDMNPKPLKLQRETNQSPVSPSLDRWPLSEAALTHSSSSSGVSVLSRSLSNLSDGWSSSQASAAMTPATPATTNPCAVGERISIQEYVSKEWQGNTKKAQTISKGYLEVPGLLGLRAIRVVRGDNYCAVRGTMFQALVRGLPLPSGQQAASRCSQLLSDPSGRWFRGWNFAGRLPYAGDNVENGIRDCLLTIDSTVERLQSASDKESALANMLNTDPWLDARLCEAAKLLMLVGALELQAAVNEGQTLPLFAELLFARDSSTNPCDLMNNHLRHVGDTAGLEQVEMFLLGYSLGVSIRVVRPSAFGSQDYVCSYPNPEDIGADMSEGVDNRRLVDLLAEDDRHYNVLLS